MSWPQKWLRTARPTTHRDYHASTRSCPPISHDTSHHQPTTSPQRPARLPMHLLSHEARSTNRDQPTDDPTVAPTAATSTAAPTSHCGTRTISSTTMRLCCTHPGIRVARPSLVPLTLPPTTRGVSAAKVASRHLGLECSSTTLGPKAQATCRGGLPPAPEVCLMAMLQWRGPTRIEPVSWATRMPRFAHGGLRRFGQGGRISSSGRDAPSSRAPSQPD